MSATTLHVKFPQHWKGWNIPEFTGTLTDDPDTEFSVHGLDAITVNVESAHSDDYLCDSPVFRATTSSGVDIALKFALRDDFVDGLVTEAEAYTGALKDLQGSVVPRFYGLYTGSGEEGQIVACLVLEHYGECLKLHFEDLALDTRILILQRLRDFHQSGLHHDDFAERNVLQGDDGDIRLIDFDQTRPHDCDGDFNVRPGKQLPDSGDVCCDWLWEICNTELRIWDSQ